jgi:5-methylcytosine-specific restriction endonuclease McrA
MKKQGSKSIIVEYFKEHVNKWIHNQTFREITKANDVPRTIRTLRQEGWQIETRGDGYHRLLSKEKLQPKGIRKSISRKERYLVFHRDGFRCRACGLSVEDGAKLTVDHIIPVEWGGPSEMPNYQSLCKDCNEGKQHWVKSNPPEIMKRILSLQTVDARIEALFDAFPNQDIPSSTIQLVSKGSLDWQRAIRRIRQKTSKRIVPVSRALGKSVYRYFKD